MSDRWRAEMPRPIAMTSPDASGNQRSARWSARRCVATDAIKPMIMAEPTNLASRRHKSKTSAWYQPPESVRRASPIASTQPSPTTTTEPVVDDTAPRPMKPSPDLGVVTDAPSLVAALTASGVIDNLTDSAVQEGRPPDVSICTNIVQNNEPGAGVVVHHALATLDGLVGVVIVLERTDGSREVRMYGTGDADPVTGG